MEENTITTVPAAPAAQSTTTNEENLDLTTCKVYSLVSFYEKTGKSLSIWPKKDKSGYICVLDNYKSNDDPQHVCFFSKKLTTSDLATLGQNMDQFQVLITNMGAGRQIIARKGNGAKPTYKFSGDMSAF